MKKLTSISKYRFKNFCEFVQNVGELGHELYVQKAGTVDRYFLIHSSAKENHIIPVILELQGPIKKEELSQ